MCPTNAANLNGWHSLAHLDTTSIRIWEIKKNMHMARCHFHCQKTKVSHSNATLLHLLLEHNHENQAPKIFLLHTKKLINITSPVYVCFRHLSHVECRRSPFAVRRAPCARNRLISRPQFLFVSVNCRLSSFAMRRAPCDVRRSPCAVRRAPCAVRCC